MVSSNSCLFISFFSPFYTCISVVVVYLVEIILLLRACNFNNKKTPFIL